MRIVSIVSGAVLLCASVAAAQTPRTTPAACAALVSFRCPGVALTVTKAEWFAAGAPLPGGRGGAPGDQPAGVLPPRRRDRSPRRRRRRRPTASASRSRFPENWNGRFLFQGGGGLNGSVQPPLGGIGGGRQLRPGARLRRRQHRHRPSGKGRVRRAASGRTSRRASTSPTPRSAAWPRSPSGSSRSTTASRRTARTSPGAPPAGARRC